MGLGEWASIDEVGDFPYAILGWSSFGTGHK